eukprot:scpid110067/ scgid21201/ 
MSQKAHGFCASAALSLSHELAAYARRSASIKIISMFHILPDTSLRSNTSVIRSDWCSLFSCRLYFRHCSAEDSSFYRYYYVLGKCLKNGYSAPYMATVPGT